MTVNRSVPELKRHPKLIASLRPCNDFAPQTHYFQDSTKRAGETRFLESWYRTKII